VRALAEIIKTTVVGGILFLLPVVLIIVILKRAVQLVRPAIAPLAGLFPEHAVAGVAVATLLSAAAVFLICLAAGIVARTRPGRTMNSSVDRVFVNRVPLYRLAKSMIEGFAAVEATAGMIPALARIDDAWQLGFILEEHGNGLLTVFVPQAPSPMSGSVYYLPEDRVQRLDVPVGQVYRCITHMGIGSKELLQGRV
jgi:uncharacterized membrane protein